MAVQRSCDICRFYKPTVRRYGLSVQVPNGRTRASGPRHIAHTTIGAGGLDLCADCWEQVAGPKCKSGFDPRSAPAVLTAGRA